VNAADSRPLIAHVVYRFDVGGLENGVVNLINHMPPDSYRHAVIALTEITDFRKRIKRDDVTFIALGKPPGQTARIFPRLWRLFRQLRPAIVHTRNLGTLETQVPAWAAGVRARIHGEHGRDVGDLDGSNVKYQWIRRFYRPFVTRYIALSRDLEHYLTAVVGVPRERVTQLYNGVDTTRFRPSSGERESIAGCPFGAPGEWLIGTVGRMQEVKDQLNLTRAFILLLRARPEWVSRLRMILIGDGPLRRQCQELLDAAGLAALAWLPGERSDVPELLRSLDCFVLPSLAEGISNTILEAMGSGLPVIATDVGGNADLVDAGRTGIIVPPADPQALATAIGTLAQDVQKARDMGAAGRALVMERFSMESMTNAYAAVYDASTGRSKAAPQSAGTIVA
jgi:sugar transferase (PEP-CTERM/EpsH1 system associated)